MQRLNKVTLPNNHPISKCWHPHYHLSPFQEDSAKTFEKWHRRRYSNEIGGGIMRAVPLCVFAGVQFSQYVLNEHANGTYAVCRSCTTVIMCGYDRAGLTPRSCGGCDRKLELNDYFQPVEQGSNIMEKDLVDPEKDPAMTIAEVCALAPEGIPLGILGAVIAVLHDENLIEKGGFIIESLEISGDRVTSRRFFSHCFTNWPTRWIEVASGRKSIVKITGKGKLMLTVREIKPKRGARKRIAELLALNEKKTQAIARRAIANQHLVSLQA